MLQSSLTFLESCSEINSRGKLESVTGGRCILFRSLSGLPLLNEPNSGEGAIMLLPIPTNIIGCVANTMVANISEPNFYIFIGKNLKKGKIHFIGHIFVMSLHF